MDSTSNEDIAVQASKEMVGNGTIDSGVAGDNDSNSSSTPPAPPLPPPSFQSQPSVTDDTPPPEPQAAANDDNNDDNNDDGSQGDIRYKLMQIYKPKDSGPVDTTAPLPELNHSTPATPTTVYPAVIPDENTTEPDAVCTNEDGENETAKEADDDYTYEEEAEDNDTQEESAEDTRVKTDLGDPAQVAEIVAMMNSSRPSTPPPAEAHEEDAVNSDTRCSTPRTAELDATNSDTPPPAESPNISDRGSRGSYRGSRGSQSYPIDVYTEDDDFETVPDEQPPPAYSTASTVENGQTRSHDVVDTKVPMTEKTPKPKVSKKGMPNNYMKLSVCACLCNVLVGIVAITFAIKSKDAWKEGKKAKARSNGLNALFCALFGIFSFMAIVGIVLWLEVITDKSGL
ncbi:hypothetical protein NP493_150g03003 [Ridgeia piscesae]|uniref:Uncharacterized protein n=1 Tax=Ridgeia piscesae TaxID=27915 RepID=A0AAD9UFY5_RIDPI|nr:hypothetical protein NP493_150g03003 [Ridgeia piscesae]